MDDRPADGEPTGDPPAHDPPGTESDRRGGEGVAPEEASPTFRDDRPERAASATVNDGSAGPGATVNDVEEGERRAESATLLNLPDDLARDWEIERELESRGGEASLLLVRGRRPETSDERRIIKIYNSGISLRPRVVEAMGRIGDAHVVHRFEHRRVHDRDLEVLEYMPLGSMDRLLREEGLPLPQSRVEEVIRQLFAALVAIHDVDIVHRDLKPGNVLVRSTAPLDLVLTDFGIASFLEGASRRETTGSKTFAYAPPEANDLLVSHATDWWSLGILIVEISTGRHPFAEETSNELISHGQINRRLREDDVEEFVRGVPEYFQLLCRGLLRRQIGNRWGAAEVGLWLEGDRDIAVPVEDVPGRKPFRFAGTGRDHYSFVDVARALSEHWSEGMASFGRGELPDWIAGTGDAAVTASVREIEQAYRRTVYPLSEALFRTILLLDPAVVPSVRGFRLDEEGLRRLADTALRDDAEAQPARDAMQEVLERGYLSTYAELRGRNDYLALERHWHAQLDNYVYLAPFVPEEGRQVLDVNLPLAVALGLRSSLPDDGWDAQRRSAAQAARVRMRHLPGWFTMLESHPERRSTAALFGIRALAGLAIREAEAEAERIRSNMLGVAFTPTRLVLLAALILMALIGVAALLGSA